MQQQNNPQKQDSLMDQNQPVNQPEALDQKDTRDEQIKNETDTRRLRSERQSVIDGDGEKGTDRS